MRAAEDGLPGAAHADDADAVAGPGIVDAAAARGGPRAMEKSPAHRTARRERPHRHREDRPGGSKRPGAFLPRRYQGYFPVRIWRHARPADENAAGSSGRPDRG